VEGVEEMYCLFDASVIAAYYCPKTTRSHRVVENARNLIESVRSGESNHFFYIPNFCIAEVFSVFMKYAYSRWNKQTKSGRIDGRVHKRLREQFEADIHNAKLFYHYELSRYHVLAINLVAPIDHHYKLYRKPKTGAGQIPSGTFDELIIAMAIHLVKIHGRGNVIVITSDDRLARIIAKCRSGIPDSIYRRLKLKEASDFTGVPFRPDSFPVVLNLKEATKTQLRRVFGRWPLPINNSYDRPYLAKP
jgi:rRNA-processing protein FCF1